MPVSDFEHLSVSIHNYSSQKRITPIWHGGEPLLAGIDYYREICAVQKSLTEKLGIAFLNNVQTNATLIDDEWASFFRENNFHVGVSLDGPKEIHDLHRKNFAGEGSFDKTMRGINILKEHGFHPGVICVVNKDNIALPDELFNFFYDNGLPFKTNDCTKSVSGKIDDTLQVEPDSYSLFLLRIFDLWIEKNDPNYRVAPIDNFVKGMLGHKTNICKLNGGCQQNLSFDINGDVYPCDGYLGENQVLGNFLSEEISSIVGKALFSKRFIEDRKTVIANCGSCKMTQLCNGFCMRQWDNSPCSGKFVEKATCSSLQSLWSGLSSRLKKLGYDPIF